MVQWCLSKQKQDEEERKNELEVNKIPVKGPGTFRTNRIGRPFWVWFDISRLKYIEWNEMD